MEWLGRATINYTHAPTPRTVKEKDGTETDLLKISEAATPPCNLNPFLFNGHAQTLWTATKPVGPKIYYKRKIFEADHKVYKGSFAVDFVVEPFEESDPTLSRRNVYFTEEELENMASDDSKPMLVVMHGMSGGSHEVYLRTAIAPMIKDGAWEVCVIIARGCARSKITTPLLYNARATWDLRQTVKWLQETFPNRPLFGLGFSLGANILTNYCGEEGEKCVLKGAVVLSNPWNLEICNITLRERYMGKEVYLRAMGTALKGLIASQKEVMIKDTEIDFDAVMKITYIFEFDRIVERASWGYPNEYAYYRDSSCTDAVLAIRIPFLSIHSTDDPIAVREAIPYEEIAMNPNVVLLTTSLGGHLCWFEMGGTRWFTKPVANFLNHLAFKTDLDSLTAQKGPDLENNALATKGHIYKPMNRRMVIFDGLETA